MDLQVTAHWVFVDIDQWVSFFIALPIWVVQLGYSDPLICIAGEEWETFLQAPHWQCWGITSCCLHTNCWWSLPKVWFHIYSFSGSLYQLEGEVSFTSCIFVVSKMFLLVHVHEVFHLDVQGKDPWGAQELAREEHSSYCCHWWWTDFGAWRSWMSGSILFQLYEHWCQDISNAFCWLWYHVFREWGSLLASLPFTLLWEEFVHLL